MIKGNSIDLKQDDTNISEDKRDQLIELDVEQAVNLAPLLILRAQDKFVM